MSLKALRGVWETRGSRPGSESGLREKRTQGSSPQVGPHPRPRYPGDSDQFLLGRKVVWKLVQSQGTCCPWSIPVFEADSGIWRQACLPSLGCAEAPLVLPLAQSDGDSPSNAISSSHPCRCPLKVRGGTPSLHPGCSLCCPEPHTRWCPLCCGPALLPLCRTHAACPSGQTLCAIFLPVFLPPF